MRFNLYLVLIFILGWITAPLITKSVLNLFVAVSIVFIITYLLSKQKLFDE